MKMFQSPFSALYLPMNIDPTAANKDTLLVSELTDLIGFDQIRQTPRYTLVLQTKDDDQLALVRDRSLTQSAVISLPTFQTDSSYLWPSVEYFMSGVREVIADQFQIDLDQLYQLRLLGYVRLVGGQQASFIVAARVSLTATELADHLVAHPLLAADQQPFWLPARLDLLTASFGGAVFATDHLEVFSERAIEAFYYHQVLSLFFTDLIDAEDWESEPLFCQTEKIVEEALSRTERFIAGYYA